MTCGTGAALVISLEFLQVLKGGTAKMIGLHLRGIVSTGCLLVALSYAQSAPPHLDSSNMPADLNGTPGSVTGYVRDLACLYRNRSKEAAKPPDDVCVKACAKAGAPLGIITPDGTIFNVISHTMPETDERARLIPYVAKTVKATGQLFERNGSHAIAIDKIEVASN
jgi:hypothetical protein